MLQNGTFFLSGGIDRGAHPDRRAGTTIRVSQSGTGFTLKTYGRDNKRESLDQFLNPEEPHHTTVVSSAS
jgi:hypothetical protein